MNFCVEESYTRLEKWSGQAFPDPEVISQGNGAFGSEDLKCDPCLLPTMTIHPRK